MSLFGGTQDSLQHCPSFIPCPPCPGGFHIRSSQVHLADPSTLSLPLPLLCSTPLFTPQLSEYPEFPTCPRFSYLLPLYPPASPTSGFTTKNEGNQRELARSPSHHHVYPPAPRLPPSPCVPASVNSACSWPPVHWAHLL